MTPEEFAHTRKTGVAPCGCRVTVSRDLSGAESRSCLHDDDCADKAAAAQDAAKEARQEAKADKAAAEKKAAAKAERADAKADKEAEQEAEATEAPAPSGPRSR